MKIRITQKVAYQDGFLHPGEIRDDIDPEQVELWLAADQAIVFEEEPAVKKPKAVKHGDG